LYKTHRSASQFYGSDYSDEKDILTERIKTNRFGD